jgi:hypothetical protein
MMIDESKLTKGLCDAPVTVEQLALMGDGLIAYVKPLLSDDARKLFPQVQGLPTGLQLFALLSAEGAPILLTDSRDAALANAWEHKLQTVSLH